MKSTVASSAWEMDWHLDSADFIDLGEADGVAKPVPVAMGGVYPFSGQASAGLSGTRSSLVFSTKRSYGLKWTAVAALLPVACTGLHIVAQTSAIADHEPAGPIDSTRWYIGIGAGLATLQPDAFCDCLTLSEDNDTAFNLYAGIDISRRFAIEFQYANLGAPSVDFLGTPVGSCLLYTSPSPRDATLSRMPSSA